MNKNDICHNCLLEFKENSIQYLRRLKNNAPKICQECYRIQNAEETHKKRLLEKAKRCTHPKIKIALDLKSKYTYLGPAFLQAKMNVSYQEAVKLIKTVESLYV